MFDGLLNLIPLAKFDLQWNDYLTLAMAFISIAISGFALWYTSLRFGKLKASMPNSVFLQRYGLNINKIKMRLSFYVTGVSTKIVEKLRVTLKSVEKNTVYKYDLCSDQEL